MARCFALEIRCPEEHKIMFSSEISMSRKREACSCVPQSLWMQNKSVKYSSSVVLWTLPYIQEPNFHTETLWKHVHFSSKATNMGRIAMASCVPEQFPNCRMLARKLAQYWSGTLAGHPATFGNTLQKWGSSPQGMKTGWPDLVSLPNLLALEREAENLSRPGLPQKTLDLLHQRVLPDANW